MKTVIVILVILVYLYAQYLLHFKQQMKNEKIIKKQDSIYH